MVTITSRPADIHTAYNPIKFKIDSTLKAESGFRYLVIVKKPGILGQIASFKIAPDPTIGGLAEFDISNIIRDYVDKFLNLESMAVNESVGTNLKYDIVLGESYDSEWGYQDYVFPGGGAVALTSDSALVGGGSDIPHGYTIGDQIFVQNNVPFYGDTRDLLNGYHTVTAVISPKTVAISVTGVLAGASVAGKTRYADFRKKILYSTTAKIDGLIAVNAVQGVLEYSLEKGDLSDYVLNASTQKFLTNMSEVEKFYATEEQSLFVNMLNPLLGQQEFLYFENDTADLLRKFNSADPPIRTNSIGPGNLGTLGVISGTAPLVKPTTKYYDVWVGDTTGGTQYSEKIRIYIDKRCKINDTEILFMDRKGSFMSFAFQNKGFENISTERSTYRKYISDYKTYSDGVNNYHSILERGLELNANFMSESMNDYYEELFTSRYTYVKFEGIWYACTVQDTTLEIDKHLNNKFIKKTLRVKFDLTSPIN